MADEQTPASAFPPGEYVTRDGRKAGVYANDAGGTYPVHGAIWEANRWRSDSWTADGLFDAVTRNDGADLLPPRPATRKVRVQLVVRDDARGLALYYRMEPHPHSAPFDSLTLRDMPDGKHAEVEVEIIDRRPK